MRQRVEDFGRLSVLIRNLLDHSLFNEEFIPSRSKDYSEWFNLLSAEKKDDVLHAWVYGIEELQKRLYDMLEIAEETDSLNEGFSDGQK